LSVKNTILKKRVRNKIINTVSIIKQIALTSTLLSLLVIFVSDVSAQKRELGFMLGGSFYMGDMNQLVPFKKTRPAGAIIYRYNYNPRTAFKASVLFGQIAGEDASTNNSSQLHRNLDFKTYIAEVSAQWEFNFLNYKTDDEDMPFSPYFFAGLSLFNFNPKGSLGNDWYKLHDLSTETNKKNYSRFQIAIPFGLGLKYAVNKHVTFGAEWGMRKTFTDYLDDLSGTYPDPTQIDAQSRALSDKSVYPDDGLSNTGRQRGNPDTKDWYSFFGLTFSYKFHIYGDKCPSYN
jgi:hypothetical protein